MIIRADAVVKFFIDLSNKDAIKGINEVESKSDALAKKFNSTGKVLTIGLTTPLVGFGAYAVKTANDFDQASNQMQASLGLTTQEAEEYNQVMKNIYNANYGESFEDVANAISIAQQELYEFTPDQIEEVTESAFALRDVFGIEITDSIRATKALITNFGTTSEEAMNLLTQGFQNGLNYSDEFIDNINEYSVQFGKLGLTAEDMFNIFQSGADAGAWNLDKIGDAVKEFSIRAIDGSDTTIDGFTKLGMNADKMAQKFASGGDTAKEAFYEVIDAIGAMEDPVEQSIVGVDLFGTMWEDLGPEVVTQLGSIRDMYDQTNASMENLKNVKYDDLGSMLETLKRQFSDIALDVGNELMPAIQSFIGGVQNLVTWFKNLDPETKTMIGNIAKVAAILGPVLITISKLVTVASSLKKRVKGVTTFFSAFKDGQKVISMLKMGGVGIAITAVAALLLLIVQNWDKIKEVVGNVWNAIKDFFSNLGVGIANIASSIANWVSGIWTSITTTVSNIWNSITSFLSMIGSAIWGVIQTILGYLQWPIQFVTNMFLLIVALVSTFLQTIYNTVVTFIQTILNVIGTIASWIYNNVLLPVFNFFSSIFTAIYNTIATWVNTVFSIFSTIASWVYNNVLSPIFNFFSSVFTSIWNVVSGVINKVKSGFSTMANAVKTVFNNVKNFISNIFSTIGNIIKAPINGIISVINTVLKGLNKIKIPDWVPVVGGKGINFPMIPKLATGTNYVAGEGLAYLHEGEAVVPKKYNPAIGGYGNYNQPIYVTVNADMDVNKFGKAFVRDIKTFSGGTKNSYNYGGGK